MPTIGRSERQSRLDLPRSDTRIRKVTSEQTNSRLDKFPPKLQSGAIKPILAKSFPLAEAADALRYLSRPFGRVVLTI